MKKRCVVWGMGEEYERILNQIFFEIMKGNMSVEAIVCRKQDRYCNIKDGFPVISKDELIIGSFDYLIVSSSLFRNEIKSEAIQLGVAERQIVDGSVFLLPLFDFGRYCMLIENPVTILADDCWGGMPISA